MNAGIWECVNVLMWEFVVLFVLLPKKTCVAPYLVKVKVKVKVKKCFRYRFR